jgi:hypothetical protein
MATISITSNDGALHSASRPSCGGETNTCPSLAAALGPDGYARRMLREDRDAQIREVARWLAGGTLH